MGARQYNIGIACGPSGLVVIDLDLPREDAGDDDPDEDGVLFPLSGADRLSRLARANRERYPGDTYVVDTPSGGCHLYFSAADGKARNSAGAVAPHIDVRAGGGYVVGAGSRVGGQAAHRARNRSAGPTWPPASWLGRLVAAAPVALPGPAPRLPVADRAQGRAYAMAALRAETSRVARGRAGDAERHAELGRLQPRSSARGGGTAAARCQVITGLISAAMYARAAGGGSGAHCPVRDDGRGAQAALLVTGVTRSLPAPSPTSLNNSVAGEIAELL